MHFIYFQLGIGDKRNRSRPILLTEFSTKHVSSVTCGAYHTLAITSDYKVYAWGWGIHGQLGLNSAENQVYPQHVKLLDEHRIVQAAAGHAHSAVLTSRVGRFYVITRVSLEKSFHRIYSIKQQPVFSKGREMIAWNSKTDSVSLIIIRSNRNISANILTCLQSYVSILLIFFPTKKI